MLFRLTTIRNKLIITFTVMTCLTAGISLTAIFLFGSTRKATHTIIAVNIPAVVKAYNLSATAKGIAAAASSLAASETEPELRAANQDIHHLLGKLNTLISDFSEQSSEKANQQRIKIHVFVDEFEPVLREIYNGRKEIITIRDKIAQLADTSTAVSAELMDDLEPIKTAAGFNLSLTLIELSKTDEVEADYWRKQAFQTDMPNFQYSMELGLSIQGINSHLVRAGEADTMQDLKFHQEMFNAYLDGINRDLEKLGGKRTAQDLFGPIYKLTAIGLKEDNIFKLRARQFYAMGAIEDKIAAGHRIASNLTHAAHGFSAGIIDSARAAAERIHQSTRTGTVMAVAMALATIVLAFAIGWRLVARDILGRITTLRQMMIEGQQGKLNLDIDTAGSDEIADMSNALAYFVRQMRKDLDTHKENESRIRNAMKRAEAASEAKSNFLANMSHEIRTPMNGIIGYSSLMMGTPLNPQQQDFSNAIKTSADHLLAVIDDILDLSKIEAGHLVLENVHFNMRKNLENAVNTMAIKAQEKNLEIICRIAEEVPVYVVSDPGRLRQIVVNLIGNAVKFTKMGIIRLNCDVDSTTEDTVRLHFCVSDTGIGISPEKRNKIFDSFEQADTSTTREFGGTGLGLTISKQLVEVMGGRIWVESMGESMGETAATAGSDIPSSSDADQPGPGSTFHFTIQARRYKADDHTPSGLYEEIGDLQGRHHKGLKILLVEDNLINQKMAVKVLESGGHDITTADDGQQAIDILEKNYFDVVIMDVQMPVMDGITATKAIRKSQHHNRGVPIVAMTAHAMKGDKIKCIEAGMDDYLSKPIDPDRLFSIIDKQVIEKKRITAV